MDPIIQSMQDVFERQRKAFRSAVPQPGRAQGQTDAAQIIVADDIVVGALVDSLAPHR